MYIDLPRTDDATTQEQDAYHTFADLFDETVSRTGMDTVTVAKLSVDTMYALLTDLDRANDVYDDWN